MNDLTGDSDQLKTDIENLLFEYRYDHWRDKKPDEDSLYDFLNRGEAA